MPYARPLSFFQIPKNRMSSLRRDKAPHCASHLSNSLAMANGPGREKQRNKAAYMILYLYIQVLYYAVIRRNYVRFEKQEHRKTEI